LPASWILWAFGQGNFCPEAVAQAQANRKHSRFNKGVSGRGTALLKPRHIEHLHRLARGYKDIDFVAEGLLPAAA